MARRRNLLLYLTNRFRPQLFASLVPTVAAFLYVWLNPTAPAAAELLKFSTFLALMGVIGGVLALVTAVGLSHLVFFVGDATNQRREAFHRMRARLFALDAFLEGKPLEDPIVDSARSVSFELKKLGLQDFPNTAAADLLREFAEEYADRIEEHDRLALEILEHFASVEHDLRLMGLGAIRQIVAPVVASPMMRGVYVLAAMIGSVVASVFVHDIALIGSLVAALPVFFATFSALLLVHLGSTIRREMDELVDFLAEDTNDE